MTTETETTETTETPAGQIRTADFLSVVRQSEDADGWCSTAEDVLYELFSIRTRPTSCNCRSCRDAGVAYDVPRFTPEVDTPAYVSTASVIAAVGYLFGDRDADTANLRRELNVAFKLGVPDLYLH